MYVYAEKRADGIEAASKDGEEFNNNCNQLLHWIQATNGVVMDSPALTGDPDALHQQAMENKVGNVLHFDRKSR